MSLQVANRPVRPSVNAGSLAAATTSNAAASSASASSAGVNTNSAASRATGLFKQQFGALAASKTKFHALMQKTFGANYDAGKAESFRQKALAGDFSWLPPVKFVDAGAFPQGGLGAYDTKNNAIYLSKSLLNDPAKAASVAVEEMGHFLDAKLNKSDTPGDEGAVFRRLLNGENISKAELAKLRTENDKGSIVVNGQRVDVEFGIFKKIKKAFKKVGRVVTKPFKAVKNVAKGVFGLVKNVAKKAIGVVTKPFKKVAQGIGGFFKKAFSGVKNVFKKVTSGVGGLFKKAFSGIGRVAKGVFGGVKKVFGGLFKGIGKVLSPITKVLGKVLAPIAKVLKPVLNIIQKLGPIVAPILSVVAPPLGAVAWAVVKGASLVKGGLALASGKIGQALGAVTGFVGGKLLGPVKRLLGPALRRVVPAARRIAHVVRRVSQFVSRPVRLAGQFLARNVRRVLPQVVGYRPYAPFPGLSPIRRPIISWPWQPTPRPIDLPNPGASVNRPVGGAAASDSSYGDLMKTASNLGGEINNLKSQLAKTKDPNKRQELMMKIQELQQQRTQLLTMISNLMKAEHEAAMAFARNLR